MYKFSVIIMNNNVIPISQHFGGLKPLIQFEGTRQAEETEENQIITSFCYYLQLKTIIHK